MSCDEENKFGIQREIHAILIQRRYEASPISISNTTHDYDFIAYWPFPQLQLQSWSSYASPLVDPDDRHSNPPRKGWVSLAQSATPLSLDWLGSSSDTIT